MKRLIISLALALSVLAASVFEVVYVSGKSDGYAERINNIDHLISDGNSDKALAECKKLEADWESGSRKTYTLLSHDAVDSIGFCVSRMSAFLAKGSYQMYFAESTSAKKGLASIKGSEYPLIENIL